MKNIYDVQSCCVSNCLFLPKTSRVGTQTMHKNNRKVTTLQKSLHVTPSTACKSWSSSSLYPRFSKTAFSALSWGQVSTVCTDLPRKQRKNDIRDFLLFGPLPGGHIVCFESAFKSQESFQCARSLQWTWTSFNSSTKSTTYVHRLCTQNHQLRVGLHQCQVAESVSFIF